MQPDIASAFGPRELPSTVTEVTSNSTLRDDALNFRGVPWIKVTAEDWANHSDAFYGLSPQAFLYYLPSILAGANKRSNVADMLVAVLDTSADPAVWPTWFAERFPLLTGAELQVLKSWAMDCVADVARFDATEAARVQDTLAMLELICNR